MSNSTTFRRQTGLALAAAAVLLVTLIAALSITGQRASAAPTAEGNIVRTATAAGQFTTLLTLAKQAGLVGALSGRGPLTVFAPTDAAFRAVPKATLERLAKNRAALLRVLLYHVV